MTNELESKVSHILNILVNDNIILHYYKFFQNMQIHIVVADHLIIKNNGVIIFIECKSARYLTMNPANIFKPHQVQFNKVIPNHYYLFCYYRRKNKRIQKSIKEKTLYYIVKDITTLIPSSKTVLKIQDFNNIKPILKLEDAINKILEIE